MARDLKQISLLLIGHGSSKCPDSSISVNQHAELLNERGTFADVRVRFLKEKPYLEDVLPALNLNAPALPALDFENPATQYLIVPDFLAEGYFTQLVIPRLLRLDDRPAGVEYTVPVGAHPLIAELIDDAALAHLKEWAPEEVSLLIVGHGSTKNKQSKQTLLDHIAAIKKNSRFAQIEDLWLEESPYLHDWEEVIENKKVIVVPFLLSDGQHGAGDIPKAFGLKHSDELYRTTHQLDSLKLRMTHALGSSPRFAEVIEAIARG